MSALSYPHLESDAAGRAIVSGTATKVSEIVLDHLAHRWTPEDIAREHPHLDLAQIHAAFAYYDDHQAEIDAEIVEGLRTSADLRERLGSSLVRKTLEAARTDR